MELTRGGRRRALAQHAERTVLGSPSSRKQVGRFVIVGLVNTAVAFAAFRVTFRLLQGMRGAPAAAQIVSYAVGILCSFALNRRWTFRSDLAAGPEFARFVASQLAMLTVSGGGLELTIEGLGLPATPSWVLTTGLVAGVNFLLLRHWVFRARGATASAR
jgi:putative flippase GtrA